MNLNQLRYFVSVADYRSFHKAAECHYITQTAITLQIKALEEGLGMQLIDRSRRPIELTPAGIVFYREARGILSKTEDAIEKAREASMGKVGSIRIGYEKGYERSDLSDRLGEFHRVYPNILFTCVREDTDKLATGLLAGSYDVIFSWDSTNLRGNKEIASKLDLRSGLSVAVYGNHPFAFKKTLRREELRDETIIYMSPSSIGDSFGDGHFMSLYEKAGYQPKILLTSSDTESILMMVAAEEGISILPSHCVNKLVNANNLVFIPLEGEEESEDIFMFWRREHRNSALDFFLDYTKDKCEGKAGNL